MQYTEKCTYRDMGEFLFRKWMDGDIEPDDWFRDDIGYEAFARFGKRVIVDYEGSPIDYTRHPTIEDAIAQMDDLHENRSPTEWDGIVAEDRGGYYVILEGDRKRARTYDTYDEAVRGLAEMMVDAGCFPDAFYQGERGYSRRIDMEVRNHHDDGGDKMRPLSEVLADA